MVWGAPRLGIAEFGGCGEKKHHQNVQVHRIEVSIADADEALEAKQRASDNTKEFESFRHFKRNYFAEISAQLPSPKPPVLRIPWRKAPRRRIAVTCLSISTFAPHARQADKIHTVYKNQVTNSLLLVMPYAPLHAHLLRMHQHHPPFIRKSPSRVASLPHPALPFVDVHAHA